MSCFIDNSNRNDVNFAYLPVEVQVEVVKTIARLLDDDIRKEPATSLAQNIKETIKTLYRLHDYKSIKHELLAHIDRLELAAKNSMFLQANRPTDIPVEKVISRTM